MDVRLFRQGCAWICAALVVLVAAHRGFGQTTAPTTGPVYRTPADTANAASAAVHNLDSIGLAQIIFIPNDPDGLVRQALSKELVEEMQIAYEEESQFGRDGARRLGSTLFDPISRPYTDQDWRPSKTRQDMVIGLGPVKVSMVHSLIRVNGGWYLATFVPMTQDRELFQKNHSEKLASVADLMVRLRSGQFASVEDVIRYSDERGHQAIKSWQDAHERELVQEQAQFRGKIETQQFDAGTFGGLIGAYMQGRYRYDVDAVAKCFYADGDADGRFARANGERIVAVDRLVDAHKVSAVALMTDFGLSFTSDQAEFSGVPEEHGDRATGALEGGSKVRFRKIGGAWKIDVTPASVGSLATQAQGMEQDVEKLKQVTADVLSGKYTTDAQVRDALLATHLAAQPDPTFKANHYRLQGEYVPS